jgi:hypothetical protein
MNRLRVRVELNRRKAGVPLEALVSVVDETRKFFHLLAEDVQIDPNHGVWLASDFDPESLNFTAEYDGPASAQQIRDFGAAFGGSTSLRQETIAQFTHIADMLGEDELVGFGLFQSDQETEPSDWRCLSRRDAARFANEIHLLAKSAGEPASPLSAAMNGSVGGRRLFKDRRERDTLATDPSRWIREVESNLSRRVALLEQELETQKRKVPLLENTPEGSEDRFRQLITALESFAGQSAGHSPGQGSKQLPAPAPAPAVGTNKSLAFRWVSGFLLTAAIVALAGLASSEKMAQSLGLPLFLGSSRHGTTPAMLASDGDVAAAPSGTNNASQIPLEVPPELRSKIESEALVNVTVSVDEHGKVSDAKATSIKGQNADLLIPEALKAARSFLFRPARSGEKPVRSQADLNFVFEGRP